MTFDSWSAIDSGDSVIRNRKITTVVLGRCASCIRVAASKIGDAITALFAPPPFVYCLTDVSQCSAALFEISLTRASGKASSLFAPESS
jgi:hypothetical protein